MEVNFKLRIVLTMCELSSAMCNSPSKIKIHFINLLSHKFLSTTCPNTCNIINLQYNTKNVSKI